MEKAKIIKTLKELKEKSQKRNFNQTYDLIITLKDMDLKKTENHVDFFQTLHYPKGRKVKVCALIGPEMEEAAKAVDKYILVNDFEKYTKDKKATKKLAGQYDNAVGNVCSRSADHQHTCYNCIFDSQQMARLRAYAG